MPFTLAHPAAVLVLRRTGLPMAALVAGSMAPDAPLFAPWPVSYGFTHSLAGVVSADLLLSLVAVALWFTLIRDALVDMSPEPVRQRLAPRARYHRRQWLLAVPAAVVGSLTHVAWDLFTHRGRWGTRHVPWLAGQHGPITGYRWAQLGSGIVGVLALLVTSAILLSRLPRTERARRVPVLGPRVLLAAGLATLLVAASAGLSRAGAGVHAMGYHAAIAGVAALVVALLTVVLAWCVLASRPATT